MIEPNISVREHIRWGSGMNREPTSTLVLTSSRRSYIDIRIYRPTKDSEPDLPNEGGPMSRLEWAFAGTSSTTFSPPKSPGGDPILHSKWEHWLDSSTDGPVSDEGDMYPQADGIHTLETGVMVNPATGIMTAYEENWADVAVQAIEVGRPRSAVVLVSEDLDRKTKGMIIRVGQFCQGLIKVDGEVSLERWMWKREAHGKGEWTRVARLGRLFLPCAVTFEATRLEEGGEVEYGDYKWTIKEVHEW